MLKLWLFIWATIYWVPAMCLEFGEAFQICTSFNPVLIITNNPKNNHKSQVLLSLFHSWKVRLRVVTQLVSKSLAAGAQVCDFTLLCFVWIWFISPLHSASLYFREAGVLGLFGTELILFCRLSMVFRALWLNFPSVVLNFAPVVLLPRVTSMI